MIRLPPRRRPDALYRDGSRGDDRLEVTESVPGYVSFRLVGEYGTGMLLREVATTKIGVESRGLTV